MARHNHKVGDNVIRTKASAVPVNWGREGDVGIITAISQYSGLAIRLERTGGEIIGADYDSWEKIEPEAEVDSLDALIALVVTRERELDAAKEIASEAAVNVSKLVADFVEAKREVRALLNESGFKC